MLIGQFKIRIGQYKWITCPSTSRRISADIQSILSNFEKYYVGKVLRPLVNPCDILHHFTRTSMHGRDERMVVGEFYNHRIIVSAANLAQNLADNSAEI